MTFLYKALSHELADNIKAGVYKCGDRLPGVRDLSRARQMSPATIVAAYRELEIGGLIEARDRSGFYVARRQAQLAEPLTSSPQLKPKPVNKQAMIMRMIQVSNQPRIIQLGAAIPTGRFMPLAKIDGSIRQILKTDRVRANSYLFPPGLLQLRQQIAKRLANMGCQVDPDTIQITTGAQEALYLALAATTQSGDTVAVESPCYYGVLLLLEHLGLKALEIPTHPSEGISVPALELALEKWPLKACLVVTSFSNPIGSCMSENAKQTLVKVLAKHQVPLIEDDIYGDLAFNGKRPQPAKKWDKNNRNYYVGSFSKSLSPGLRIGWLIGPKCLNAAKFVTSGATAALPQLVANNLLATGFFERHLKTQRTAYRQAMDTLHNAIIEHFPAETRISQPEGGFIV